MNLNDFKEIIPADFKTCRECVKEYNNSESSIATMYMWQHYANTKYRIVNNVLYSIYRDKNNKYCSFMPYGKNRNSLKALEPLMELYKNLGIKPTIKLCTEDFVEFIKECTNYNVKITPVPNSFDYVYRTEDLINLSGKKYHNKKNHINYFNKNYKYNYVKYDDSLKDDCINFCSQIIRRYYGENSDAYNTELFSITKTFNNINQLNLKCGIIFIDNNIVALSVGEKLNDEYALIHIEKADYKYRTAYSVINNLFLINEFSDTIYVNREEDMGIEGLKKAKSSYHPCHMIKKYNIEFI